MELQAHELRIGNLFQEQNTKEVIMVTELSQFKIGFSGSFKGEWQAKPIPLTEEWLLKFGFNKEGNTIYKELNGFEFGTINTNRSKPRFYLQTQGSTSNITLPIKFIHQLQNLYFALTGEELSIK